MATKPYAVLYWGSNPDEGNDDCHQGFDFDTLAEAEDRFAAPAPAYVAFVELDSKDDYRIRANPGFRKSADDDSDWRSERAMQAGMMGGCEAYNDANGWD